MGFMGYIKKVFSMLIGAILPPSPDSIVTKDVTVESLLPRKHIYSHNGIMSLFSYEDEIIKALLWQLKFKGDRHISKLLGDVLADHLKIYTMPHLIIPVPLSRERFRERGYNQVSLIAERSVARIDCVTYFDNVLVRTRDTVPQMKLSREKRLNNLKGAFAVPKIEHIINQKIILLDDIVTTGATLREARDTLLDAGARTVIPIAIAHS